MPLSRVELHIHLDGAVRLSTVWELAKEKNIPLPGEKLLYVIIVYELK